MKQIIELKCGCTLKCDASVAANDIERIKAHAPCAHTMNGLNGLKFEVIAWNCCDLGYKIKVGESK